MWILGQLVGLASALVVVLILGGVCVALFDGPKKPSKTVDVWLPDGKGDFYKATLTRTEYDQLPKGVNR